MDPPELVDAQHVQPRRLAHIGLTVPRLDAALAWHTDVLGFEPIAPPATLRAGEGDAGRLAAAVFGEGFVEANVAQLATGSAVGLELFEFRPPQGSARSAFEYWRAGWFHMCVLEREIEALCARIERHGGHRLTDVLAIRPGGPYRMCYCQDPFGTVVEIHTHAQGAVEANLPAADAAAAPTGGER
jgi:catechol 2,3-dioxygenase-like lactoylglutathione lyase family enzyme